MTTPTDPSGSASDDLGTLPGSLVGAQQCAQVTVSPRYKRASIAGAGAVRLSVFSPAVIVSNAPARVMLDAPARTVRSVKLTLNGRSLRAKRSLKRLPGMSRGDARYSLSIAPAVLAAASVHSLQATLTPRKGKAGVLKTTLRSAPCVTRLSATRAKTGRGSSLRMRLDSRTAVTGVSFALPRGYSLRAASKAVKVGRLKLVSAGAPTRLLSLTQPAKRTSGALLQAAGQPNVSFNSRAVTVSGLPARTGIVELMLFYPKPPAGPPLQGQISVKARPSAAGAAGRALTARLR